MPDTDTDNNDDSGEFAGAFDDVTSVLYSTDKNGFFVGRALLHNVHKETQCGGERCVIHNPSNHHMSQWRLLWRDDRVIFERICPEHGIGHPDPDQFDYWDRTGQSGNYVHGCCGCCRSARW